MIRTVFGSNKSGTALIPYFDSKIINLIISTRSGNSEVTWFDGSKSSWTNPKNIDYTVALENLFTKTHSTVYTGDIAVQFLKGLKDVYSLKVKPNDTAVTQSDKLNITNISTFLKQFPNLYSFVIENYSYGINLPIINGNVLDMPDSVEKISGAEFQFLGTIHFDMSGISPTSKLKKLDLFSFNAVGAKKLIGDLGKMPTPLNYLDLRYASSDSAITYTAGKVWASSFDTLYLPIPLGVFENDDLLIDLKNSVTSAIGSKVIYLGVGYRTSASDYAITYLTGLGFTITGVSVIVPLKILDLPLQNNFTDSGEIGMTMVDGATSNLPTFALSGRKAGEYCAVFNGSQSIKTTTNLPINSDKVTIPFWMKTTQTSVAIIAELSSVFDSNNAFAAYTNSPANRFTMADHTSAYNRSSGSTTINNGSWHHIVATIDRSLGTNQTKIYINNSLVTVINTAGDLSGNFVNNILYIGQRAGSTTSFNGSLTRLKIYNYPFTASEVSNLYNSEL